MELYNAIAEKLTAIPLENINKGDTVILKTFVSYAWGLHLCSSFTVGVVEKITPKKTKATVVTSTGATFNIEPKSTTMYEATAELITEIAAFSELTRAKKALANYMYAYISGDNKKGTREIEHYGRQIREAVNSYSVEKIKSMNAIFNQTKDFINGFYTEYKKD